jgi:hypothetical protein
MAVRLFGQDRRLRVMVQGIGAGGAGPRGS